MAVSLSSGMEYGFISLVCIRAITYNFPIEKLLHLVFEKSPHRAKAKKVSEDNRK